MYGARRRAPADRAGAPLAPRLRGRRSRSGSATPPHGSSSSTSTARCSTRCTSAARLGLEPTEDGWQHGNWRSATSSRRTGDEPDDGIWEVRGPTRHFTHSKVMAWVAFDRAVKTVERLSASTGRSTAGGRSATRSTSRSAARASTPRRGAFVQSYGSNELDASLLMIPLVGFLPATDPRVAGTVEAIEREPDATTGSSAATRPSPSVDGLPRGEGRSCLLVLAGRLPGTCSAGTTTPARLFERLLALAQRRRPALRGVRRRGPAGSSATSRRRSRMSPWSTRPSASPGIRGRPGTRRKPDGIVIVL